MYNFLAIVYLKSKYLKLLIEANKCTIITINSNTIHQNRIKLIYDFLRTKINLNSIHLQKIIIKNKGLKIKKFKNILISKFLKSNNILLKNNILIKKINKNILIFIQKNNIKINQNNNVFFTKNYFDSKNCFFDKKLQKIKKPKKK